jgi:ribonucleoside-triphosphate reductase
VTIAPTTPNLAPEISVTAAIFCGQAKKDHAHQERDAQLRYRELFTEGDEKMDNKGKGVKFERIRRITGYLVGTLDRWNEAKKSEERDRVKHEIKCSDKRHN